MNILTAHSVLHTATTNLRNQKHNSYDHNHYENKNENFEYCLKTQKKEVENFKNYSPITISTQTLSTKGKRV